MICVYSLRAGEKPTVSFPLEWSELEKFTKKENLKELQVIYSEAVSRAEKKGDLFREVLTRKQKLPHL